MDQGYQQPTESLVVKDLTTLKNLFTLPISDLAKQNPAILGAISFVNGGWSRDGRYIWYAFDDFADPANVIGFMRVDASDWSYRLFQAPLVTMGGDAFDTGMTTYSTNVAPWTGDAQLDQLYKAQAKETGQLTSFYIYDLPRLCSLEINCLRNQRRFSANHAIRRKPTQLRLCQLFQSFANIGCSDSMQLTMFP